MSAGYIGNMLHLVGSGILGPAITSVVGGRDKIVWITAAITFHSIVGAPAMCKAADYYGRKWMIILPLFAGTVGCIIVARANSIGVVLAGQAIAGFSQIVSAFASAVPPEVIPRKYRGWALASVIGPAGLGATVGILACGAMTQNNPEGFRNYWYFVAAFYAVSGVSVAIVYNPPLREQQRLTLREKLYGLDLPGITILSVSLIGICLGLSWSDNPYGWGNVHVLLPFIVGVVAAVVLAVYSRYFRKDGFFHHGLFAGSWNFALVQIIFFAEGVVFICANNYMSYQLVAMYGASPWEASLIYSITWLTLVVASPICGWYITKTRQAKVVVIVGFLSYVLYFALMAATNQRTKKNIWGYNIFLGFGLAVIVVALVAIAQLSAPADLISPATGLMISSRVTGATVGLVIFNAILSAALKSKLVPSITEAALSNGLPSSSLADFLGVIDGGNGTAIASIPGVTEEILDAVTIAQRHVFNIGFRNTYATACAFSAAAVIGESLVEDPGLVTWKHG